MKLSLSYLTCVLTALLGVLSGCANNTNNIPRKQPIYQPPYLHDSGYGQNVAPSRLREQPSSPTTPVISSSPLAAPTPAAPVSSLPLPAAARAAPAPGATSVVPQGKTKVALLLPLSGKNATLGQAMLNAAQQAVFDSAAPNFELRPRDTGGEGGAEGAARAAAAEGAQLIVGPLFAADVPAAKMVAENAGIPLLPLSTDTSLAERGVYVMGLAPAAQVDRVVAYAAAHGARHFAALVPNNAYGVLVGHAFQNAVAQVGGTVIDYESYDSTAHDSEERVKVLAAQRETIDALFLPESGADLKAIADQLGAAGFSPTKTHILGSGMWDVSGLGTQSALLIGGWYAAPDPSTRRNYIAAYAQSYGQEPPRLTTLAYDATALAAVLAKRGGRFDEAALTNPNGFAGLDGIFRLSPSGSVERALAINMVTADSPQVIDPAPTSFVGEKRGM